MSIFFGSVGPDDFSRNYAAWAKRFGLTDWADWFALYATAPRVLWTAVLISFVYLSVAFIIPSLVSKLQRQAATVVVPSFVAFVLAVAIFGQFAIGYPVERHVSEYQRAKLKEILSPIASTFPRALSVAAADNPEANGYAIELMVALGQAGLKIASLSPNVIVPSPMRALTPNVKGVFFQTHDPNNPPQETVTLAKALNESGIVTKICFFRQTSG